MSTNQDDGVPTLSAESAIVLIDLLTNVNLPVSHPQFEEVAAMWAKAKRELVAIERYASAVGRPATSEDDKAVAPTRRTG